MRLNKFIRIGKYEIGVDLTTWALPLMFEFDTLFTHQHQLIILCFYIYRIK